MQPIKPLYDFSPEKNLQLIKERELSFEEVIAAIHERMLVDVIEHPNQGKYPGQQIYIVNLAGYICLVPFARKDEHTVFLKTIIPSRKLTKHYFR